MFTTFTYMFRHLGSEAGQLTPLSTYAVLRGSLQAESAFFGILLDWREMESELVYNLFQHRYPFSLFVGCTAEEECLNSE